MRGRRWLADAEWPRDRITSQGIVKRGQARAYPPMVYAALT